MSAGFKDASMYTKGYTFINHNYESKIEKN